MKSPNAAQSPMTDRPMSGLEDKGGGGLGAARGEQHDGEIRPRTSPASLEHKLAGRRPDFSPLGSPPFLPSPRSRRTSRELPLVAYRTRRAFRAQYDLLLAAASFEEATARVEARSRTIRRHLSWRLMRDVESRRTELGEQLRSFRGETLQLLSPGDVLPGVRQLLLAGQGAEEAVTAPPRGAGLRPGARLASVALGKAATYACLAAWVVVLAEIVVRGISNRPSLVIAEVAALALSPGAVFPTPPLE